MSAGPRPFARPFARVLVALLLAVPFLASGCASSVAADSSGAAEPGGGPALVYEQDFSAPESLADFTFSDPSAWHWSDADGVPSLELVGGGRYAPPHRSPREIALIADLELGDFDLEAELLQTGRQYGHRDLCLFFGFQSPTRYYYVHLAPAPDPNAHNVFLVDDAPRRNLAPVAEEGIDWGDGEWHRVRLERRLADGSVRVFFDDLERPVLEVKDETLGRGRVGFGSFDDSGRVSRVRIRAPEVRRPAEVGEPFGASGTRGE